jgi:hypothetical protein
MGFRPTYFRYDGMPTMNRRLADSVVVEPVGVVPNINFTVRPITWNGFAEVAGIVKDNSGNKINGAYILFLDQSQQICSYAVSDLNGKFTINGILPGLYSVISEKMGYTSTQSIEVTVDYLNNLTNNVTFTLTPEGVTSVGNENNVIKDFVLYQNYPNPFNPSTTIKWYQPHQGKVSIRIYDVIGNEIDVVLKDVMTAGEHQIEYVADGLPSGIYFYKIVTDNFIQTKKMILLK